MIKKSKQIRKQPEPYEDKGEYDCQRGEFDKTSMRALGDLGKI
jgi:hypothetical protein